MKIITGHSLLTEIILHKEMNVIDKQCSTPNQKPHSQGNPAKKTSRENPKAKRPNYKKRSASND